MADSVGNKRKDGMSLRNEIRTVLLQVMKESKLSKTADVFSQEWAENKWSWSEEEEEAVFLRISTAMAGFIDLHQEYRAAKKMKYTREFVCSNIVSKKSANPPRLVISSDDGGARLMAYVGGTIRVFLDDVGKEVEIRVAQDSDGGFILKEGWDICVEELNPEKQDNLVVEIREDGLFHMIKVAYAPTHIMNNPTRIVVFSKKGFLKPAIDLPKLQMTNKDGIKTLEPFVGTDISVIVVHEAIRKELKVRVEGDSNGRVYLTRGWSACLNFLKLEAQHSFTLTRDSAGILYMEKTLSEAEPEQAGLQGAGADPGHGPEA